MLSSKKVLRRIGRKLGMDRLLFELNGKTPYPPGHFYSPIPDPKEIDIYSTAQKLSEPHFPDINFRHEEQLTLAKELCNYYAELPFKDSNARTTRYQFDQSYFCYADAIFLYSFLRHFRPKNIIEIGSGYSTAVMLDTIEKFKLNETYIRCIEPFPERLKGLLREGDAHRLNIIEDRAQNCIELLKQLEPSDLLFIDSSHVCKFGSDVHFYLFQLFPIVKPGVFIHIHDIFKYFEYPRKWINDGRYWNESYIMRAFLSCNNCYDIILFINSLVESNKSFFESNMPLCLKNTGGSLYLKKIR